MLISTDLNRHPASLHGGCLQRHDTAPWVILQIMLNGETTRLHIWTAVCVCVCVCVCVWVCVWERESGRWGERRAGCSLWLQPHHRHPQMNRWKQMLPSTFPACHFPLPLQHVCSLEPRVNFPSLLSSSELEMLVCVREAEREPVSDSLALMILSALERISSAKWMWGWF